MTQASPAEMKQALQERHAVELNGVWRTVDKAYMHSLLETALFLSVQQGWSHDALPQADLLEGLQANGHDARLSPLLLHLSVCVHHRTLLCLRVHGHIPVVTLLLQDHGTVRKTGRKGAEH